MLNTIDSFLATSIPVQVPENGLTVALATSGVVLLGLFARFMKNRKK